MSTRHLDALFNPRSIVILGASERPRNLGGIVLRNLLACDYPGKLLILNPKSYTDVHGVQCVGKVSKMPFVADLAIICSPPETVPRVVRELGKAGVKTAMVLTGGLSRTHSRSGRPLMYSVRDAARQSGIRVLGPNTIGIMVPHNKLNATFAHMGVLPGKIAFIGQSGTIASAVIDWALSRGIGFSHFMTLGDSIDIDPDDLIDYLAQDRNTKAILLHIEQIPSPSRFISAVRAASRHKLVIGVKSGRVPESQWQPVRLPDGIVDGDMIFDAVLRRAGVLRVHGTDELFDAMETLSRMKPVKQDRLAIICNGLGPGVLAVDRLAYLGGELATLSPSTLATLEKLLPPYWTRKNPVDLDYDATPELYRQTLQALAQDPEIANVLVMYAPSLTEDCLGIAQAVVEEAKQSRLNIFTCWLGQSTVGQARDVFFQAAIPTFFTPEKAVKAFMYQVNHARSQALLRETPSSVSGRLMDRNHARDRITEAVWQGKSYLPKQETLQFLTDYGIPTVETWHADNVEEVVALFVEKGGPINVTLVHEHTCYPFLEEKTGRGRYRHTLHRLADVASIREGCEQLLQAYHHHSASNSKLIGFSVHHSVPHTPGLGFSLGITRDAVFGPLIVCGAAGASVNVMSDRHVALPPLNMALAKDLLSQTYMYRLLKEFSHHPGKDIRAVCEVLVTLSQMMVDNPEIHGLEILPLLFTRQGIVAVDAAIDLAEPARLIIQPYPEHLAETYVLAKSRRTVVLRPVMAEDEPMHVAFHSRLSPESIRFRFFHYRKSFSHDELAQMVQIDYDREMVFVAVASPDDGGEEETLGVVRVWTDADNYQSEFAVIVSDHMKGEGLGHKLMTKMIGYCRDRGTVEMVGSVLPENQPMLALARKLGFEIQWDSKEEVMALRLPLNKDPRPKVPEPGNPFDLDKEDFSV